MGAQVVSFLNWSRPAAPPPVADWSQQELAEFYRVESALIRAGLRIETDRGISDEGDPWFIFLRAEDGEVVVHFARVDGEYLIAGPAYEQVARGYDFNALVRAMIARHPLVQPQGRDNNVLLHPAAILVAIVGTAFFKTGEAKAMESDPQPTRRKGSSAQRTDVSQNDGRSDAHHAYVDANQALTILAGAMFAMEPRWDDVRRSANIVAISGGDARVHGALAEFDYLGEGHLKFDGLGASSAPAAALAVASEVLALTAVLDETAQSAIAEPTGLGIAGDSVRVTLSESAGTAGPPPAYLDLQLRPGPLPQVEAVEILREVLGKGLERVAIIAVEQIPEAIAEIIAGGQSFTATPGIVEAAPVIAPEVFAPIAPVGTSDQHQDDAQDPVDPVAQQPVSPVAPPPPAPNDGYKLFVQKVIDYFIDHTADVQVFTSGLEVVMYDGRIDYAAHQIVWADSLTFRFGDGSSISLVGEHSTLYHELS